MRKFERIVIFILLLLATGAGQSFIVNPEASAADRGQSVTQVIFGLIYLVLILFLVKFRSSALSLVLKDRWLAALCVLAILSVAWSVEPAESLRRSIALVGSTIAGLYLGLLNEPKEQLKAVGYAIGLGALGSVAVAILVPSVAFMPTGELQGVYFLKNTLGHMMSLGAFCFALMALYERGRRVVHVGMFLLCCVLLVLSKSATAAVVTMLMLILLPLRKLLYLRTRRLLAAIAVLGPVLAFTTIWIVNSSEDLLAALGRSSSLSGRIPLWQHVLQQIGDRPILGYGFSAFWNSWQGERVSDAVNWDSAVPHAHNGFLEVWLGLGIVGLVMILLSLSRNFLLSLRIARSNREMEYSWPLLLVIFTALYNLTENSFLVVNTTPWIAYCAASYWLAGTAREAARTTEEELEAQPAEAEPAFSS
ncbi:O-antigen ligase family protein [Alloacidobacterium dinghuense]|uniref:O-antigen ligase family protein n=1 Tax=Alloacidobacterium dinghuense TaxID=2763107 RepID=A0A7G8BKJ6_9BACT|nr:O-antigen ligase [Alloacidobacterium dinghuense]QNI33066.1 O-antigen ligase family protein [Alloacidobacterium dinghuense]